MKKGFGFIKKFLKNRQYKQDFNKEDNDDLKIKNLAGYVIKLKNEQITLNVKRIYDLLQKLIEKTNGQEDEKSASVKASIKYYIEALLMLLENIYKFENSGAALKEIHEYNQSSAVQLKEIEEALQNKYEDLLCEDLSQARTQMKYLDKFMEKESLFEYSPEKKEHVIYLVCEIDGHRLCVWENCIIGREGTVEPEYFNKPEFMYISRQHIDINIREGKFYCICRGRNRTRLNGRLMEKGREYLLKQGDFLMLYNIRFDVC